MQTRRSIIILVCVVVAIVINVVAFADFFVAKIPDIILSNYSSNPQPNVIYINVCNNTNNFSDSHIQNTLNYLNNPTNTPTSAPTTPPTPTIPPINVVCPTDSPVQSEGFKRPPRINNLVLTDADKDISDAWDDDDTHTRIVS